jgi:epoxyqueuosine reductase
MQTELTAVVRAAGVTISGVADISDAGLPGYPRAIALGIAYAPEVVARLDTDLAGFHRHLAETRTAMVGAVEQCARFLRERGFAVHVPDISRTLPGLVGEFSHKTAATKAGLGWIGKNALLVAAGYGCGFRLASVLTDAPLTPGNAVTASRCGTCRACVDACPYGAIRGVNWFAGIPREDLLDAVVCHEKREAFVPELGFKHPCGLCIRSCPHDRRRG